MIKSLLSVIILVAIVGGAIKFEATEDSWSLVVNKEDALYSVQNGAIRLYELGVSAVESFENTEEDLEFKPLTTK